MTNTLQKKLNEVRREKAQLERLIEHELSTHVDLQEKLADIRRHSRSDDSIFPKPFDKHVTKPDILEESPDENDEEEEEMGEEMDKEDEDQSMD